MRDRRQDATTGRNRDRRQTNKDQVTEINRDRPEPLRRRPRRTHAERGLAQRLAQIDRIRDRALETGNVQLLHRADALEKAARDKFKHRDFDQHLSLNRPNIHNLDPAAAPRAADRPASETGRSHGQQLSELARTLGAEFGHATSESATDLGRDFGKLNADKTRVQIYQEIIDLRANESNGDTSNDRASKN